MPAFSNWLERSLRVADAPAREHRLLRGLMRIFCGRGNRQVDGRRCIVVADFEPPRELVEDVLGEWPGAVAMPQRPADPLPGVRYSLLHTDRNPYEWGAELDGLIPRRLHTVLVLGRFDQIYGRTLRHWARLGIRWVHFLGEKDSFGVSPLAAFAFKAGRRMLDRGKFGRSERVPAMEDCAAMLAELSPLDDIGDRGQRGRRRIVHHTYWLDSGGAERQLANLAVLQHRRGHDVRVLTQAPPIGRCGHYCGMLADAGVEVRHAGAWWHEGFPERLRARAGADRFLAGLPAELRRPVVDLAGELLVRRAEVLHCWLDRPNIVGLLAAQLAGTPAVVLSLRNVNPRNFPHLHEPWMRSWYQVAARLPGVALVNNSEAGARDYEDWLGLPFGSIRVVRNAFMPPPAPSAAETTAIRAGLGLTPETPVVAGIFRLDPEKRPFLFLEAVRRLREQVPGVRILHAGRGQLEGAMQEAVRRLGLADVVHLLGQRADVAALLSISQILLLTSEQEGTPNVVLEAQHFGCVPVATEVGGTGETMQDGLTGRLLPRDDLAGLVGACAELLTNEDRRRRLAAGGVAFLGNRFDPGRILAATHAVYESLLGVPSLVGCSRAG